MVDYDIERIAKSAYLIGGVYDLLLGLTLSLGLFFIPDLISTIFDVPVPDPLIFPITTGLFLIAVGYYLVIASSDPLNYDFIAIGSIFVKFGYVLAIMLFLLSKSVDLAFIIFAITDFTTGIILLIPLTLKRIKI
jgi:hypothetical protein